jgi:hypothetical protein
MRTGGCGALARDRLRGGVMRSMMSIGPEHTGQQSWELCSGCCCAVVTPSSCSAACEGCCASAVGEDAEVTDTHQSPG